MGNYIYILQGKIGTDLPVFLGIFAFCTLLLVITIYHFVKTKRKSTIVLIICFSMFLLFILYNLGYPLAMISYDYLAGCKLFETVDTVDNVTGDRSNYYIVIDSKKYILPSIFKTDIKPGDFVDIVYAERSKCIVSIWKGK